METTELSRRILQLKKDKNAISLARLKCSKLSATDVPLPILIVLKK